MNVAACICGELRVLESVHMQNILYSRLERINPDYFFVISRWSSKSLWVNDTSIHSIKEKFSPISFLERNESSIENKYENT